MYQKDIEYKLKIQQLNNYQLGIHFPLLHQLVLQYLILLDNNILLYNHLLEPEDQFQLSIYLVYN